MDFIEYYFGGEFAIFLIHIYFMIITPSINNNREELRFINSLADT